MELTIRYFGQVAEATAQTEEVLSLAAPISGKALITQLEATYKGLEKLKFKLAVNQEIIAEETMISASAEVALLPPFAGG